jgi:5'-methylthioadenosine phosphorylase
VTRVGLIVGTGFDDLPLRAERLDVETPYGDVQVAFHREDGLEAVILPRHGPARAPAHVVDHKANVDALARCKAERVIGLCSVGALAPTIPAGALVVPDDYLDLRPRLSYHDDSPVHVDVSEAYCPTLRALLVQAARREGAQVVDGGVYACTEGPRLETRAEVRMLRQAGGAVVGMTGGPEAALARERALCYATLCLVTNPAAGVLGEKPSAEAIRAGAKAMAPLALRAALAAARAVPAERACGCARALDDARL